MRIVNDAVRAEGAIAVVAGIASRWREREAINDAAARRIGVGRGHAGHEARQPEVGRLAIRAPAVKENIVAAAVVHEINQVVAARAHHLRPTRREGNALGDEFECGVRGIRVYSDKGALAPGHAVDAVLKQRGIVDGIGMSRRREVRCRHGQEDYCRTGTQFHSKPPGGRLRHCNSSAKLPRAIYLVPLISPLGYTPVRVHARAHREAGFPRSSTIPLRSGAMKTAKPKPTATGTTFTAEERAAMKARIAELKAEANRANGEAAVTAAIAGMPQPDRGMAERLHALITAAAPALEPKTWYGMPAYA